MPIQKLNTNWKRIKRLVSRIEWARRLLRLPKSFDEGERPGLVIIQIDGLSRPRLMEALEKGNLPWLQHLLTEQDYKVETIYTGLPSTTPAAQGELFFGEKTCVPAFQIRDNETKEVHSLYDPQLGVKLQDKLSLNHQNSLAGGGAVSDIFSGDPDKSALCVTNLGIAEIVKNAGMISQLSVLAMHFGIFFRIPLLMLLEAMLAFYDAWQGVGKNNLFKELFFIPTRVFVIVLLREATRIVVSLNIARGVPIIHCNFQGYDEHSHRRGPDSDYAMWTLKGIDDVIKKIWQEARQASTGNYEIWIHSDHGQQRSNSYQRLFGKSIFEAVTKVLMDNNIIKDTSRSRRRRHPIKLGILLGGRRLQKLLKFPYEYLMPLFEEYDEVQITAMGPVAHIYLNQEIDFDMRYDLAQQFVEDVKVPIVLIKDDQSIVHAFYNNSVFRLPEEAAEVFGEDHPFLDGIAADSVSLACHEDAGDFVFFSWSPDGRSYTFPYENGSHGGPGPDETHAFLMTPYDVDLEADDSGFLRHSSTRKAALRFLQKEKRFNGFKKRRQDDIIRIMTYNVHGCIGMDGKYSTDRIARIIARHEPDIIALQELDVGRERTGCIDQAEEIAKSLNMDFLFHPSFELEEGRYGNAIMSRLPIKLIQAKVLPGISGLEPRGAIMAEIINGSKKLYFLSTHLGLTRRERTEQLRAIMGKRWVENFADEKIIICGDFNFSPTSLLYREITDRFTDAYAVCNKSGGKTWMGVSRIDYVFLSSSIQVSEAKVLKNYLTSNASDHLPLIVDIKLNMI